MTPTSSATRPTLARAVAAGGIAGIGLLALAGCAATADGSADAGGSAGSSSGDTSASYADGSYTATGEYVSPAGEQTVDVELTLEGDVVTAVTVTPKSSDPQSNGFQEKFAGGIEEVVVGVDIDELDVSRVAGSSLTSGGFADAVEQIKAEALEA